MKPKSRKNKVRDLRDNMWGRRAFKRREELDDGYHGWRSWPVPSWYSRALSREERPHEREMLDKLKRDPESDEMRPRRNKKSRGYYW